MPERGYDIIWLTLGVGLGILVFMLTNNLQKKTTVIEVQRDEEGRIVGIVEVVR